ncbi:NAD(P)/FAD-dependent oxidoreductase [Hoeflea prorocentri]|uniref:FAD-binding oxidoreductase n=1 Tax=Hoeflea prorocentri TaxID=1922333 RepID=A0A9X3UIP6_9HYPH|nr:FAD-binding oxidoreductase [Hoeflea prorocentri]MCY6381326.1 FAD-binding oxidoreductase [Hoeflea prorocentri]MDA5399126.1 FAD-binding oxidoreductase [Hoeflea prorocentri]
MTQTSRRHFDIAVIGAGMAGASLAYELAGDAHVAILEMESHPGYHATGRSAAVFSEVYGPGPIRALTRRSRPFFENPPETFGDQPLLSQRGVLYVARADQNESFERLTDRLRGAPVTAVSDAAAVTELVPLLRPNYAQAALYEELASDIDVHALHHGYLRGLRSRGGELLVDAAVNAARREDGVWELTTRRSTVCAPIVVNAAGAWADELASIFGAEPVGLVPKRRTALTVAAPSGLDPANWAAVVDVDEQFYLKPDAGRLLISPADETPSAPCDAQPEEIDVAICIDRIQKAFALDVHRVEHCWAGLRSFVADGVPVCGYDETVDGLFWLAGHGGYGIQSAPGLSQLAAGMIKSTTSGPQLTDFGFDIDEISPKRLLRTP